MHRVDCNWMFETASLDHSILRRYVRTYDQLAGILTKGKFTTMQWHSLSSFWQIRRPYESSDVRRFSRKPFSFSAVAKHQTMSPMMTQARYVDQMWDQDSAKVLKSDCILGDIVTFEQLTSHEFAGTQDTRELLAGMLSAVNAEVECSFDCEKIRTTQNS